MNVRQIMIMRMRMVSEHSKPRFSYASDNVYIPESIFPEPYYTLLDSSGVCVLGTASTTALRFSMTIAFHLQSDRLRYLY